MEDDELYPRMIHEEFNDSVSISPITKGVYKIIDSNWKKPKYVKIWPDSSKSELEELISIEDDIGMPRHKVIKENPHIVVMDSASGDSLSKILFKYLAPGVWSIYRQDLVQKFEKLGHTIGQIHNKTQRGSQSLNPLSLSFDRYSAITADGLADFVQDIICDTAVAWIESQLPELSDNDIPTCIVHGDLMLFHVYMGEDGRISLIDFDNAKKAPFIEDIVRFTSALELYIERIPYATRSQFHQLRSAFERGYNETGLVYTIDQSIFDLFRAIRHCSMLSYYHFDMESGLLNSGEFSIQERAKHRLLRRIDTKVLKRIISRLAS